MDYNQLAQTILQLIGGKENVQNLVHCATRLRFNLSDEKKANTDELKKTKGVMGVVVSGGQYQVVIGSDVANVYKAIMEKLDLKDNIAKKAEEDNRSIVARGIDLISGIFTPILPAITAAGMLKAILALLIAFKVIDSSSSSYQVINFMADAAFYFLPILLANSAAKKFNCNAYLAMMMGGILLHPNFIQMVAQSQESGEAIRLFFIPISNASYASSVIPIILCVWLMSYVEPFADKISPKPIKFFLKPLIIMLIVGVAGLAVLGPLGYIIGNYIAAGINLLETNVSWLVPMIVGTFSPLLVMTGTHYGIIPIGINNLMTTGRDTVVGPGMMASNIAQGAASLAVGVKTKDSDVKQLAISSGITGVCGITEPVLYGINLRYKTPLIAAMIGGGTGGLFMGITHVNRFASGSPGLLTLPVYIGGDGMNNFFMACIGAAISFVVSFLVALIIYKDSVEEVAKSSGETLDSSLDKAETIEKTPISSMVNAQVYAPMNGEAVELSKVSDPTFAEEILGKGAAIIPADGHVVSPINGTVAAIFDTKHAIALVSDEGLEILIHIGLDTVKLNGKYYEARAKVGDKIQVGTPLVDFDIDAIKKEGYDTITPVIITNGTEYGDVLSIFGKEVKQGDTLIKVLK